ncbi:MAG: glycerol-3-phosphate dehydrogenase [Alphaproteobacteria bacterium]|nr:glycerol-3-phosphate dehydrogenase [Alphaproteobacteria bacterium]MDE2111717.1 glycerol-3-phosphate dehydrogenase [Alphaproteobacteria bacterium]
MSSEEESPSLDLIIVGGGVNGAGIARDAAGRGLQVALFEQHDLSEHTSSKSTKLIHGGLRYLEYYEFRLVREALREREVLLNLAPHIIKPLRFVLPHTKQTRPAWMIRIGLFLYDRLGGRIGLPRSQAIRLSGTVLGAPLRKDIRRGFAYSDAWVDDTRLVILNALDAAERGAQIHTRTKVLSARRLGSLWQVEVLPAKGPSRVVTAKALVNAAGPWVEGIRRMASPVPSPISVRLVKGSHIIVPKLFDGEHAYILQNTDGRVLFAIPYEQDFTLIGTTDIPFDGDRSSVDISAEETSYLCDGINRYFERQITPQDVVWSYAGVRPLYDDKADNVSAVTRDYILELDTGEAGQAPMLSIYGGKITTYRRLAEHALQKLLPNIPVRNPGCWTAHVPLPGGDMKRDAVVQRLLKQCPDLMSETAERLAAAYGTRAFGILGDARSYDDLGRMFGADLSEMEVRYLVDKEWARGVEDVLWRRSKLGLHMTSVELETFGNWFSERTKSHAA